MAALFAFLFQFAAVAAHQPAAAPETAGLSLAAGFDVKLCSPSRPDEPTRDHACGDLCPLCQFAAHAALIAPGFPASPSLPLVGPRGLGVETARDGPVVRFSAFAEARGPPLAV